MAGEGWFGGGADLTPYYLNDGDVEEFHRFYKDICDRYDNKVSFMSMVMELFTGFGARFPVFASVDVVGSWFLLEFRLQSRLCLRLRCCGCISSPWAPCASLLHTLLSFACTALDRDKRRLSCSGFPSRLGLPAIQEVGRRLLLHPHEASKNAHQLCAMVGSVFQDNMLSSSKNVSTLSPRKLDMFSGYLYQP